MTPATVSLKPAMFSVAPLLTFILELALIALFALRLNVPPFRVIVPVPALKLLMLTVPAAVKAWLPLVEEVSVVSVPPTAKSPPAAVIPLPDVGPWLATNTFPVVLRLARTMFPLVLFVVGPLLISRAIFALPALRVVPVAMVIVAGPASRFASTTPLATVSLAVRLIAPLFVVMLALTRMLRPAWSVSVCPAVVSVMALVTVMSLLAWRTTLPFTAASVAGSTVKSLAGVRLKALTCE